MELLESLEPGDMVKVYKIDRLARSLMDLLSIPNRIQKVGTSFQSLTEPVDTSTSAGRMMTPMLGRLQSSSAALFGSGLSPDKLRR